MFHNVKEPGEFEHPFNYNDGGDFKTKFTWDDEKTSQSFT